MKKILLITLVMLVASSGKAQLFKVFGQEIGFVYVGPKVGMNMSKISNITSSGSSNVVKYGYQFGAVGEFGITSRFAFQTEVNFMSRGNKEEVAGGTSTTKLNYIGIPLLAKMAFNVMGLKKVYLMGGTYQDIKTGGMSVYEYGGETFEYELHTEEWKKVDWGLALGAGAEYPTKIGIFGLDLRYNLGLTDTYTSMSTDDGSRNTNQAFGFSLTYKYDLVDLFFKSRKKSEGEGQPVSE
jgi:hypothetical protein